jgi:hypothetical protein
VFLSEIGFSIRSRSLQKHAAYHDTRTRRFTEAVWNKGVVKWRPLNYLATRRIFDVKTDYRTDEERLIHWSFLLGAAQGQRYWARPETPVLIHLSSGCSTFSSESTRRTTIFPQSLPAFEYSMPDWKMGNRTGLLFVLRTSVSPGQNSATDEESAAS